MLETLILCFLKTWFLALHGEYMNLQTRHPCPEEFIFKRRNPIPARGGLSDRIFHTLGAFAQTKKSRRPAFYRQTAANTKKRRTCFAWSGNCMRRVQFLSFFPRNLYDRCRVLMMMTYRFNKESDKRRLTRWLVWAINYTRQLVYSMNSGTEGKIVLFVWC